MQMKPVYKTSAISIFQADCLQLLKGIPSNSIDVIATDPPYFLSNGGISCQNGKIVSVDKGDWDKETTYTMEEFYRIFLTEAKRILKANGTMWIFGTMHNIYTVGYLLKLLDFKILNNITWQKPNPAPNLSKRMFTHSTETILWAKQQKGRQYFNYEAMLTLNNQKQMKDLWMIATPHKWEKKFGKHPTQKPIEIMERIILASTNVNDVILDPFMGSGTTLIAAQRLGRRAVGIELESEFIQMAINRLEALRK